MSAVVVVALLAAGLSAAVAIGARRAWRRRRARDELVARACHELRGPLAAAHLALQAGLRSPAAAQERLAAIDLELRRAALALDDLVAARAGRRAPDRHEDVDVAGLVAQQAGTWRAVGAALGTRVTLRHAAGLAVVRGDRVRLAQAIGNLLANAVEHGGGPVELRVRRRGGRVRVEVADRGPGLPAAVGELAHATRGTADGRGRGLAIAADIVERHGGSLVDESRADGACVALELPVRRQAG